jgi:hypothetical protein
MSSSAARTTILHHRVTAVEKGTPILRALVTQAISILEQRLVTNWHRFAPESEHVENGKSFAVVNKGPETPDTCACRCSMNCYPSEKR